MHMQMKAASATWIGNWDRSPGRAWCCLDQSGLLSSDLRQVWFDSARLSFIQFEVVSRPQNDLILTQLEQHV